MKRTIAVIALCLGIGANASEDTCAEWGFLLDPNQATPLAPEVEAQVRGISEEYLKALGSDHPDEAEMFWDEPSGGRHPLSSRSALLQGTLGLGSGHISTVFRKAYSVPEAGGSVGTFVVLEYGTRSESHDSLHAVVWIQAKSEWKVFGHGYILACPPDSAPVRLAPAGATK